MNFLFQRRGSRSPDFLILRANVPISVARVKAANTIAIITIPQVRYGITFSSQLHVESLSPAIMRKVTIIVKIIKLPTISYLLAAFLPTPYTIPINARPPIIPKPYGIKSGSENGGGVKPGVISTGDIVTGII